MLFAKTFFYNIHIIKQSKKTKHMKNTQLYSQCDNYTMYIGFIKAILVPYFNHSYVPTSGRAAFTIIPQITMRHQKIVYVSCKI